MELIEKDKLIMRVHVGEAEDQDGVKYELSQSFTGNPIVRSLKTKRCFVLSWNDILEMAIQKGINDELKEETCDSSNG